MSRIRVGLARLGRRLAGDEQGAIIVLIAGVAGSALLVCLIAMGVEFGRAHVVQGQVQSAGDSAVLALTEHCYNASKSGSKCTSATSLRDLAKLSVMPQSTWANNQVQLVGVCVDTSTATSETCSGFTSAGVSTTSVDISSCAALPASTSRYLRIVVEAASPFNGFFVKNKQFRQCVQSKWSTGTSQLTPMPFVFPACSWTTSGGFVLIQENPSQGGGTGSRNGQNCTVTWATGSTQTFTYAPNTVSSVDPLDPVYAGKACGDNVSITLGSVLTMGDLIDATCSSSVSSIDTWRSSTANARWVPIAGDYLTNSWNVTVVAFAKFDLWAYNPANDEHWEENRSGFSLPSAISNSCDSPKKLTCVYGKWDTSTLMYAGNSSSSDGIELLQ